MQAPLPREICPTQARLRVGQAVFCTLDAGRPLAKLKIQPLHVTGHPFNLMGDSTMRHLIGAMILGATLLSGTALAGGNFTLDGKNTKIEFTGTKPGGKHVGGFKDLTGTASGADATSLKLEVDIDTTSLYSDNGKLTNHLKSADFFEVKTYP